MALKILFGICILVFAVSLPIYDRYYWPEPTKKSLLFKMIAATMFLSVGILSIFIVGNHSNYAYVLVNGLVLGWIGDFLMHIPHKTETPNMTLFYSGAGAFLAGHIFYLISFTRTLKIYTGKYLTFYEVIAFAVIFIAFALMLKPVFKFKYDNLFALVTLHLYGVFLVSMLVKACNLGITYYLNGAENGVGGTVFLVLGGILFFISDLTLGMRLIGSGKGKKSVKTFSLYTYFLAQMSLSTSILFIK